MNGVLLAWHLNSVESSHRLFNALDVTFAGVTNVIVKLKAMVKRVRLRCSPSATEYEPQRRSKRGVPASDDGFQ